MSVCDSVDSRMGERAEELNADGVCDKCNAGVATRADVQRMLSGTRDSYYKKTWRAYTCGESYAYGSFASSAVRDQYTAEIGVSHRQPLCLCEQSQGKEVVDLLLREQYRRVFRDKFGSNMALSLLFKLPADMIAWENMGLVGVESKRGSLVLTRKGESLLTVVREAHAAGCFEETRGATVDDVIRGYTYLYMLKPKYRGVVAGKYGPRVLMADFFRDVPMTWIDWAGMFSLNYYVDGPRIRIGRLPGTPVVDTLMPMFADAIAAARVVARGTAVTRANVCVQFMPRATAQPAQFFGDVSAVVSLFAGTSFVPRGHVVLDAVNLAVTFEPGIQLRTASQNVIHGGDGGTTVFLNGQIELEIGVLDEDGRRFRDRQDFSVPIVCDDYGPKTSLGRWYARQFDVCSTEARFMASTCEFVLIGCRDAVQADLEPNYRTDDESHNGIGKSYSGDLFAQVGGVFSLAHDVCVVTASPRCDAKLMLNGRVDVGSVLGVGAVNAPYMQVESLSSEEHLLCDYGRTVSAAFSVEYVDDSYCIDGGGPSDSDGFYDETPTYMRYPALDYLRACAANKGAKMRSALSYALVAADVQHAMRELGSAANWRELLSASADIFDVDSLQHVGLLRTDNQLRIVPVAQATNDWVDLLDSVRCWFAEWHCGRVFHTLLREKYSNGMQTFYVRESDMCG